jgi:hypothetical protein
MIVMGWMGRVVMVAAFSATVAGCVVVRDAPAGRHPKVARAPHAGGFSSRERQIVRAYFAEQRHHGWCPPGLARKHNGCQPPGQAKKRYATGRPLPRGVVVLPLPPELEIRIGLPPRGYRYGMVDGDVVKLVVGSMLVIDAIVGLAG